MAVTCESLRIGPTSEALSARSRTRVSRDTRDALARASSRPRRPAPAPTHAGPAETHEALLLVPRPRGLSQAPTPHDASVALTRAQSRTKPPQPSPASRRAQASAAATRESLRLDPKLKAPPGRTRTRASRDTSDASDRAPSRPPPSCPSGRASRASRDTSAPARASSRLRAPTPHELTRAPPRPEPLWPSLASLAPILCGLRQRVIAERERGRTQRRACPRVEPSSAALAKRHSPCALCCLDSSAITPRAFRQSPASRRAPTLCGPRQRVVAERQRRRTQRRPCRASSLPLRPCQATLTMRLVRP